MADKKRIDGVEEMEERKEGLLFRTLAAFDSASGSISSISSSSIYRSICINSLPDSQLHHLFITIGVRTVIDIRSSAELNDPSEYRLPKSLRYRVFEIDNDNQNPIEIYSNSSDNSSTDIVDIYRIDFFTPKLVSLISERSNNELSDSWKLAMASKKPSVEAFEQLCKVSVGDRGLAGLYTDFLDETMDPAGVRRFLRLLTNLTKWPMVFHCQFGKDRTGVMAAIMHLIRNRESERWIVEDFHFTEIQLGKRLDNLRDKCIRNQYNMELCACPKIAMEKTLKWLNDRHPNVHEYLLKIGLNEEEIEKLREILKSC